jgi:hypothetical protein
MALKGVKLKKIAGALTRARKKPHKGGKMAKKNEGKRKDRQRRSRSSVVIYVIVF